MASPLNTKDLLSTGDGRLTGGDATKFFSMSNLSHQDLKLVVFYFNLVWAIADSKRQGFLGFKEFVAAMQLVSLAQAGYTLSNDILNVEHCFGNDRTSRIDIARAILRQTQVMGVMKQEQPERYLRLEHMLVRTYFDSNEVRIISLTCYLLISHCCFPLSLSCKIY